MGLFNRKKEPKPFDKLKEYCKNNNIPLAYYYGWSNHIGNPPLTFDLLTEFKNRPHLLYKTDVKVTLSLPEFDTVVRGGALGGDGFVSSSKEQVKVKCKVYFAEKGIVFKEAIDKTKDLRLAWEDITTCNQLKKDVDLVCSDVKYSLKFESVDTAELFTGYIVEHMAGEVDNGWS